MNWQAVIESLRQDQREFQRTAKGLNDNAAAMVLGNAVLLKAIADALQMGLNKKEPT